MGSFKFRKYTSKVPGGHRHLFKAVGLISTHNIIRKKFKSHNSEFFIPTKD